MTFTMLFVVLLLLTFASVKGTNDDENSSRSRRKRYIYEDTIQFKETELQIRESLENFTQLNLTLLPKFGGQFSPQPYVYLIQVASQTRANVDGPVDDQYDHSTSDPISVSVDPVFHQFTKGRWTVYGGTRRQRCIPQLTYGNGYKAVYDCINEGTYYAFFHHEGTYANESDVIDGIPYQDPEVTARWGIDDIEGGSAILNPFLFFPTYEQRLFQDPESAINSWYYSDPFKIFKAAYCYRWSYRLLKDNEVGFIHYEPNPIAIGGIYKDYTLLVWIADPSEVPYEELYAPTYMTPSDYSKRLTNRYKRGGLMPCLRYTHPAMQILEDANFVQEGEMTIRTGIYHSARLFGPHWTFKIRVNLDRLMANLDDIVFTISAHQHTAFYKCFVADIRVHIPAKPYSFLPNTKVPVTAINLPYSSISQVQLRFLSTNVMYYYGREAVFVGSPYATEKGMVQVFSNPCINQELALSFNGTIGFTSDLFTRNEVQRIMLPSLDKLQIELNAITLGLSQAEADLQANRSNNESYPIDPSFQIKVFDLAFTPISIIFLLDDSSLYFHPTDLGLRGLGYNTLTSKYKLGTLVQREWCARTSTPKNNNMWIPSFSRQHGHFVIIYQLPAEGAPVITQQPTSASCETVTDPSSTTGNRVLSEQEIHADEADDARIDLAVLAKLRTKSAERRSRERELAQAAPTRTSFQDVQNDRTYWLGSDDTVLGLDDPHFASGDNNPRNVRIATTNLEHYNDNVIFQVDANFERLRSTFEDNGLSFDIDEILYADNSTLERPAPNNRLFALHSVEHSGIEKRYLLAVGFQSAEFPKMANLSNSTLVTVLTFLANDLPVVVNTTLGNTDSELNNVEVSFSGTLIRRLQNYHTNESEFADPGDLRPEDFVDSQGRPILPPPLSRTTTTVSSINTAAPLYVLRINEVILFSSLDGSFAKPILSFEDYPTPDQAVKAKPYLPFRDFEVMVTEQGILSALAGKQTSPASVPVSPSRAFIGSVLANEPLRFIHPFHLSNNVFQETTNDGEVLYGQMSYDVDNSLIEGPPNTRTLNIPFWSLLKGSYARSAGDTNIPLDRLLYADDLHVIQHYSDPICPFASFDLYYVVFPYVEAQYRTRITAEVAYFGEGIPLEADVIVEFTEVLGVSVVVSSFLEVEYDQTIIRKTVEIGTFLPKPQLEEMYNRHFSVQSDDEESIEQREEVTVFTMTFRPSLLNLHCPKKDYFRTIQMNVGCVPFTHMRLIAEALPLLKINVLPHSTGLTQQEYQTNWYYDNSDSAGTGIAHLMIPRDSMHQSQRRVSGCVERNQSFCRFRVPAFKGIQHNTYALSFRDVLVPKFEQFLSQHARRVTGNVIIYDILDSFNEFDDMEYDIQTNTSQYSAGCLVDDSNWYRKMARHANFYRKELSLNADIYRHFTNCFSRVPSFQREDIGKSLPLLSIQELNNRTFFVFNRTNRNALRLRRIRNYIYVFRAVVVNTDYNAFSYCSNLDTFFILQVANIAVQRESLQWQLYILAIVLVTALVLGSYVYFAKYMLWRTAIVTNRLLDEADMKADEALLLQREQEAFAKLDPFRRLSQQAHNLQKFDDLEESIDDVTDFEEGFRHDRKPVTLNTILNERIPTSPRTRILYKK